MRTLLISLFIVFGFLFCPASQNLSADSREGTQVSGKVIETMDSGRYTYVRVEKNGKKTWVAVPQMKVAKGQNISFQPGIEMVHFESKTLNRTFDKIIFSGGPVN
jgi:hypothetical protein